MKSSKVVLTSIIIFTSLIISGCTSQRTVEVAQHTSDSNVMVHKMTVKDEKDFLYQMIPHHQEAIDTSKIVETQTTDPELKKFAQGVVQVQEAEIVQMKQWLKEWYQSEYVTNTNYKPMMGDLKVQKGTELEKAYVQGMISHHEGAIEMAKQVLTFNSKLEIKKMADDIITLQSAEVTTLQGWLGSKYGVESSTGTEDLDH